MFGKQTPAALKAATGKLLAHTADDAGGHVGATSTHLVHAPAEGEVVTIPWHEVVSGGWDRGEQRLVARLVDGRRLGWTFPDGAAAFTQAFRERVGASIVVMQDVPVDFGSVKVAIRKDLATRELVQMVVPEGDGVDLSAPGTARAVRSAQADLREQVGL